MSPTDAHIVTGFLTKHFDLFAAYLDELAIEPTEAEGIIEGVMSGCQGQGESSINTDMMDDLMDYIPPRHPV